MLTFDDTFVRELPGDPDDENYPRPVFGAAWSPVAPTPVRAPRVLAVSPEVAATLGIDPAAPDFAAVFAGNATWPGMRPYAAAYGGHQFGHWAGQLGDGRAITLGEARGVDGARYELQLKGAGPTPYARSADGRAVLRSSVREFLCSEAMFHLGIPTTRALSLVATGEPVWRDMFYDGRPAQEPGAVVCRVSPSFLRFGSYQLPTSRGDLPLLTSLVVYTLRHFFPDLGGVSKEAVLAWLDEVARRTVATVIGWMRVGFVHGVMNTDNLSILGLTIDYGPYGWLEPFDPDWTPNTTDAGGRRYRYGTQPTIALWNLARLAEAVYPLVQDEAALLAWLQATRERVIAAELAMWRDKLGLVGEDTGDDLLVKDLFAVLAHGEIDFTWFFRGLAEDVDFEAVAPAWYAPPTAPERGAAEAWLARYRARVAGDAGRRARMNATNPRYVLRNWIAQEVIDAAAQGDTGPLHAVFDVLRRPYEAQPGAAHYAEKRPEWARNRPGCSMLSCSS